MQAVIALAAQFGNDELKIPMSTLTLVILMVQFVAFAGALLFDHISRGNWREIRNRGQSGDLDRRDYARCTLPCGPRRSFS